MPLEEAAGSSPAEGDQVDLKDESPNDSSTSQTDANTAQSSGADTADAKSERATSLDRTLAALEPKEEVAAEGSSPEEKSKSDTAKSEDPKSGEEAEATDPDEKLPFHKHERWQQMKTENATLKDRVSELEKPASQFQAIEEYRVASNLEHTEVADGYKMMNLIKNDPGKALPYLEGLVNDIKSAVGLVLPEDLQAEVDAGGITEERALELSQARVTAQTATSRIAETTERQTREAQEQISQKLVEAGDEWDENFRKSDPDYDKKLGLVLDRIKFIVQGDPARKPSTPDEVKALSDEALAHVNGVVESLSPRRRSTSPRPDPVSASTSSGPTNLKGVDLTMAALQRG